MRRTLFQEHHEDYRRTVREFLRREVEPHFLKWETDRLIDRDVFVAAARQGIFGLAIPEEYGGSGERDFRYRLIVNEEASRIGANSFNVSLSVQDDLVLAYLLDLTTDEQKKRWLRPFAEGRLLGALAMSEPGTGSDLRGMQTRADRLPGPLGGWVLNGQKTFISCASLADVVIVAARTKETVSSPEGITLFVVERDMDGFSRGRKLNKVGMHGQDTGELFFDNIHLTDDHVIGETGRGLPALMSHLPQERLGVMASALTMARAAYDATVIYCFTRTTFGQSIGDFQNTRFALAEMLTEIDVGQAFLDRCVSDFNDDALTAIDAAKGKWFLTELQRRVVDRCVQLHGGYGYMLEYPVARAFIDGRAQTIYGGTTEIMKEIIGRDIAQEATRD